MLSARYEVVMRKAQGPVLRRCPRALQADHSAEFFRRIFDGFPGL